MRITVFRNNKDKKPFYTTVDKMLERIKKCTVQAQIDAIRIEKDKVIKKELKGNLPSILFSGEFTGRNDIDIIAHSSFAILDFDHVENLQLFKQEIIKNNFVYSAFISPSGDGLKVLVKIPAIAEKHKGYYRGLNKFFPSLDPANKNLARICYESCDSEIYININAIEFTHYIEDYQKLNGLIETKTAQNNDYNKINIVCEMVRNCANGEKNAILLRASKLMGGFISGGYVSESDAYRILEDEISKRNIDSLDDAKVTIKKGIERGKTEPINDVEYVIEKPKQIIIKKKIEPICEGIITLESITDSLDEGFKNGQKRGTTTYFTQLDPHWKWKKGEVTLIIGKPNAGKSEFILQLMLIKSIKEGDKWGVFSPENAPADDFYNQLIHSYIGKTTDPYFAHSQMSYSEYKKAKEFINKHFFYIYPKDVPDFATMDGIFLYLVQNKKINGTLIDPFNQLLLDNEMRDDRLVSQYLTGRKRFAVEHGTYDLTASHPRSLGSNAEHKPLGIYDVAQGAMWANKCDNIISIHRPHQFDDAKKSEVEIHIMKVKKQKLVGIPGMVTMDYERKSARYFLNGINPMEESIGTGNLDFMNEPQRITSPKESEEWEVLTKVHY